jgi:endonuclease YncB( thermonuclease family)
MKAHPMPAWAGGVRRSVPRGRRNWRLWLNIGLLAAATVLAIWLNGADAPADFGDLTGPVTHVVDGDTLDLAGRRIRLADLDAPERDQTCGRSDGGTWSCGRSASAALADATKGKSLTCTARDIDRYHRTVARCRTPEGDLGSLMVSKGLAIGLGGYAAEQTAARAARSGIWQGDFIMPAEWRRQHAGGEATAPSASRLDRFVAWLTGLFGS